MFAAVMLASVLYRPARPSRHESKRLQRLADLGMPITHGRPLSKSYRELLQQGTMIVLMIGICVASFGYFIPFVYIVRIL